MFRNRKYALIGAAALLGALVAVLPALGDSHVPPDAVLLDARDGSPSFTYQGAEQSLAVPNNSCEFTTDSSLISVTSQGGPPGIASAAMGVKSRGANANGTPCSQVDGREALIFSPGTTLAGRSFTKLVLDVEMTGDAVVEVFLDGDSQPYLLQTGTSITVCEGGAADPSPGCSTIGDSAPFDVTTTSADRTGACQVANSSGPNSAANDNCIWTIDPGINFESFSLSVVDIGTVSLEGGLETGSPSEFHLGGAILECGESYTLTKLGVTASYEWLDDGGCPDKSYLLDVIETLDESEAVLPTVQFEPQIASAVDCSRTVTGFPAACTEEFRASLTFGDRDKANPPDTGTLEYISDPNAEPIDANFRDMAWCVFDPFGELDPADPDRDEMRDAMPEGHSWCIVEAHVTIADDDSTTTAWTLYGIGDPFKRLS